MRKLLVSFQTQTFSMIKMKKKEDLASSIHDRLARGLTLVLTLGAESPRAQDEDHPTPPASKF